MKTRSINSEKATLPTGGFSQAVEVVEATRTVYISGQVAQAPGVPTPVTFREQAEMVWANIGAQLEAAGMSYTSIVKTTVVLTDRKYSPEFRDVRKGLLGDHAPASTMIIADLLNAAWMVEVEVIAVA